MPNFSKLRDIKNHICTKAVKNNLTVVLKIQIVRTYANKIHRAITNYLCIR